MMTMKHRAAFLFLTGCAAIFGPWAGLGCSSDDAESCIPSCADKECGNDGCGSTCACPTGLTCAENLCLLEGEHLWAMTIVGATIAAEKPDGTVWDVNALAGEDKPDGVICASSAAGSTCTGAIQDNLDPVWNMVLAERAIDLVHGAVTLDLKDDDSPDTDDQICDGLNAGFDADTLATKKASLKCNSASVDLSFQPGVPQDMYQCRQRFCHSNAEACAEVGAGVLARDICFATPSCGTCDCFDPSVISVSTLCTCSMPSNMSGQMFVVCP